MTFYVENETQAKFDFDLEEITETVGKGVLASEEIAYDDICVNLLVTDDAGIKEINKQFRDIDNPTDVLSFPNLEFEEPAVIDIPEEERADYYDPDTDELILGDIYINADRVKQQAEEYGHSQKREFAFLVAHSMLHLLGYDHMEDDERLVMEEKQKKVLDDLGIKRD